MDLSLHGVAVGRAELSLRQDKALAKKVLAYDDILCPDFAVFSPEEFETGGNLRMPLFVKPLRTDASIGISGAKSLVRDATAMMKQVAAIHKSLRRFGPWPRNTSRARSSTSRSWATPDPNGLPADRDGLRGTPRDGAPHVLDSKAKWAEGSAEFKGTKSVLADVPPEMRAKLQEVSLKAYRALHVRDYGRVDLRVAETGEIYVIDVNANCYLGESEANSPWPPRPPAIGYPTTLDRTGSSEPRRIERGRKRQPMRPSNSLQAPVLGKHDRLVPTPRVGMLARRPAPSWAVPLREPRALGKRSSHGSLAVLTVFD